jgi:hypothetical protein
MLKTFRALKSSGDFRRRHLPFLKTLEDVDLVRDIGLGEASGHPLSLKQLFAHGIGSVATIQRRLKRLKRIGIVTQTQADDDKRVMKLGLALVARKFYRRWGSSAKKAGRDVAPLASDQV